MQLAVVLTRATQQLIHSDTPRLDAEVLMSYVLQKPRSYCYSEPYLELTTEQQQQFEYLLARRKQGEPIAYLIGNKEFWSLDFAVTRDTLIPRPETELLVETVLQLSLPTETLLADLGTGPGTIALSIAKEKPQWRLHATDISPEALQVAEQNAKKFKINNVVFHQGHWCDALPPLQFDVIVSNPPYISSDEIIHCQSELTYEPPQALVAAENGLADLRCIIAKASEFLVSAGYLVLEHGATQGKAVRELLEEYGYQSIITKQDYAGLERMTMANK